MPTDDHHRTIMPAPSGSADAGRSLEDEGIFCPSCGYNLTGNLTGRCSECGSLFDRARLIEAVRIDADAMMPWERTDEFSLTTRFWRTMRISLLQPKRFALAFACQPRRSRSHSFYAICLIGLAANTCLLEALLWRSSVRPVVGLLTLALLVPIVPVNLAMSLAYSGLFLHADTRRHFRPWRVIMEYATAHWLLTWFAPLLAIVVSSALHDPDGLSVIVCAVLVWIGCSVLWIFTLAEVVRWRIPTGRDAAWPTDLSLIFAWGVWGTTAGTLLWLADAL